MYQVDTNFNEFVRKVSQMADTLEVFGNNVVGDLSKLFWARNRNLIADYLEHMMGFFEKVPVAEHWSRVKSELLGVTDQAEMEHILVANGFSREWMFRLTGSEQMFSVVNDSNWYATGTMESVLFDAIHGGQSDTIVRGKDYADLSINADVSGLRDLYPNIVDEKLMERSGGSIGVMRIFVWQQKALFGKLENIADELFVLAAAKVQSKGK